MIDERELALWIKRLETEESSWANYKKLAALYTIQNQNREPVRESRMIEAHLTAISSGRYLTLTQPVRGRSWTN